VGEWDQRGEPGNQQDRDNAHCAQQREHGSSGVVGTQA